MVSRVIGPLLDATVKRAESPIAVAGTAVIENTVSITNATPINNRRNEDAWPGDRAARHEITPAGRRIECLANKEIIFIAAIREIVLIPDTCPEPMSDSHDSQITCIPDNCRLPHHSHLAPYDGLMLCYLILTNSKRPNPSRAARLSIGVNGSPAEGHRHSAAAANFRVTTRFFGRITLTVVPTSTVLVSFISPP